MGNIIAGFRNTSYRWNRESNVEQDFLSQKKKKPRIMESDQEEPALPVEVMMEIVSWLPLKPLARAQLVCKNWRSLIQERQFMEKHTSRAPKPGYWHVKNPEARRLRQGLDCSHVCDGLLLMRNGTMQKHFVWNPAPRLVLELPTTFPVNGVFTHALIFVPATRNYKILSFFRDKDFGKFGCQVLTLGRSMEWRPLEFPDLANSNPNPKSVCSVVEGEGAAHCIMFTKFGNKMGAEIVSLDAETESFTVNHRDNVGGARAINCEGKLGFAAIDKDKQELQVMVLQDFKRKRWCRNKEVIPLPFLKDEGFKGKKSVPLLIKEGGIWFWLEREKIFVYTIETGKTKDVIGQCKGFPRRNKLYSYKPSLVTVEGMRADDELKIKRPNLQLE